MPPKAAFPFDKLKQTLKSKRNGGTGGNRLYKYSIKERNSKKVKKGTKRRSG